jgi:hypothetical protein
MGNLLGNTRAGESRKSALFGMANRKAPRVLNPTYSAEIRSF